MKICRTIAEIRGLRREEKPLGFVPTMGALHRGHAALIERARSECPHVVVSIFVNPLQFGPTEDFSRYPRAFESDVALSEQSGAQTIFAPGVDEMYPAPPLTFTDVTRMTDHLCGAFRPGHFRGVTTVVLKLLNIVQPDVAFFGEKDYQQLCIIRRMVDDLNLTVNIVGVPTVREADGLALSSRNAYLSPEERRVAPRLFEALQLARSMVAAGQFDAGAVKDRALAYLAEQPLLRVQYFEIVDPESLEPVTSIKKPVRIAAAVFLGVTRLIDNVAAEAGD